MGVVTKKEKRICAMSFQSSCSQSKSKVSRGFNNYVEAYEDLNGHTNNYFIKWITVWDKVCAHILHLTPSLSRQVPYYVRYYYPNYLHQLFICHCDTSTETKQKTLVTSLQKPALCSQQLVTEACAISKTQLLTLVNGL